MTGPVYLLYVLEVWLVRKYTSRWPDGLTIPYTEAASENGRNTNANAVTSTRLAD
jgi:hypothetical protein